MYHLEKLIHYTVRIVSIELQLYYVNGDVLFPK